MVNLVDTPRHSPGPCASSRNFKSHAFKITIVRGDATNSSSQLALDKRPRALSRAQVARHVALWVANGFRGIQNPNHKRGLTSGAGAAAIDEKLGRFSIQGRPSASFAHLLVRRYVMLASLVLACHVSEASLGGKPTQPADLGVLKHCDVSAQRAYSNRSRHDIHGVRPHFPTHVARGPLLL
jgi:hypothetical protein